MLRTMNTDKVLRDHVEFLYARIRAVCVLFILVVDGAVC